MKRREFVAAAGAACLGAPLVGQVAGLESVVAAPDELPDHCAEHSHFWGVQPDGTYVTFKPGETVPPGMRGRWAVGRVTYTVHGVIHGTYCSECVDKFLLKLLTERGLPVEGDATDRRNRATVACLNQMERMGLQRLKIDEWLVQQRNKLYEKA